MIVKGDETQRFDLKAPTAPPYRPASSTLAALQYP